MEIPIYEVSATGVTLKVTVDVPQGATVADVLQKAGVIVAPGEGLSIFARRADATTVVEAGDRVEISKPLLCDPKKARRERAERQGDIRTITAGRHGSRRVNVKPNERP